MVKNHRIPAAAGLARCSAAENGRKPVFKFLQGCAAAVSSPGAGLLKDLFFFVSSGPFPGAAADRAGRIAPFPRETL